MIPTNFPPREPATLTTNSKPKLREPLDLPGIWTNLADRARIARLGRDARDFSLSIPFSREQMTEYEIGSCSKTGPKTRLAAKKPLEFQGQFYCPEGARTASRKGGSRIDRPMVKVDERRTRAVKSPQLFARMG